jgi:hypothetical protein
MPWGLGPRRSNHLIRWPWPGRQGNIFVVPVKLLTEFVTMKGRGKLLLWSPQHLLLLYDKTHRVPPDGESLCFHLDPGVFPGLPSTPPTSPLVTQGTLESLLLLQ